MTRHLIPSTALALALALAPAAGAQPPGAPCDDCLHKHHGMMGLHGGSGHAAHFEKMAELLELTDSQREEMSRLVGETHEAVSGEMEERRRLEAELEATLAEESPDPFTVGGLTIAVHQIGRRLHAAHAELHDGLMALLTPEQLERHEGHAARRDLHEQLKRQLHPGHHE